jgi:hypothetical protein
MSRDRQADDDIREGRYARFTDDAAFLASLVAPADPEVAVGMSPEDTCKPGDPDPTRHLPGRDCPARSVGPWCQRTARDRHSTGQHVAGDDERVVAVWP